MPPIRTLPTFKAWADATAHARDLDRAALRDCERRLREAVDALDAISAQVQKPGGG
jgi:hypothetical protein